MKSDEGLDVKEMVEVIVGRFEGEKDKKGGRGI